MANTSSNTTCTETCRLRTGPSHGNEFPKVRSLTTRFIDVLTHAPSHHRSLILGASYGDARFGKPTTTGVPARHDSTAHVVWARGQATPIKWDRNRCARLSDDTVGPVTTTAGHTLTPGQEYKPRPAYALRIGASHNGGRSIKLLPESFDVQASMLLVCAVLALVMTPSTRPNQATPGC